ncbi:hypothetical protein [Sphingomicrobium nitratireducens]|uniref:hypothetical protein n=1 Tax=Sphingomicrobium nitratireducens TaxID=2964666 RepID=UPI00223F919A|nr:hypothetical protein [Sphingomicrobium nitratireducens]
MIAALLAALVAPETVAADGRWAAFRLDDGTCEARGRAWRHLTDKERQPLARFVFDESGRMVGLNVQLRRLQRAGSSVMLAVDEASFLLEGEGRQAWTKDGEQGLAIVDALRTGARMRVTGHATSGGRFTDYYPLDGVNTAIDAAAAACANSLEK